MAHHSDAAPVPPVVSPRRLGALRRREFERCMALLEVSASFIDAVERRGTKGGSLLGSSLEHRVSSVAAARAAAAGINRPAGGAAAAMAAAPAASAAAMGGGASAASGPVSSMTCIRSLSSITSHDAGGGSLGALERALAADDDGCTAGLDVDEVSTLLCVLAGRGSSESPSDNTTTSRAAHGYSVGHSVGGHSGGRNVGNADGNADGNDYGNGNYDDDDDDDGCGVRANLTDESGYDSDDEFSDSDDDSDDEDGGARAHVLFAQFAREDMGAALLPRRSVKRARMRESTSTADLVAIIGPL
jgi:hypothetical protein